jgi:hypothetical protein
MSPVTKDPQGEEPPDSAKARAALLLDEIANTKAQIDEQLKAVLEARKNADNETLLASNAKKTCEEQATAIATLKSNVETTLGSIEANKQKSDELMAAVSEGKASKAQIDEQLKAVLEARKNADSEALLAFNAKKVCEEHATVISTLKGNVEASVGSIEANKQKSDELLATVNAGKASVEADQKLINERRKEVDQSAQEIMKAAEVGASRLDGTEAAFKGAQSNLNATKEALNSATLASENSQAASKLAETHAAEAEALSKAASENCLQAKDNSEMTVTLLSAAQKAQMELDVVVDHLRKSGDIARQYEAKLEKLLSSVQSLNERVEGLLPGATSAGLASAFSKQKNRFQPQQKQWLIAFVGCMVLLLLVATPSFFAAFGVNIFGHPPDPTWAATLRSFTLRLPILAPLVWLAIYAGRNYMLSLRLEEDYAYKEAISTAFEGYKRELQVLAAGDSKNPTPIMILCTNILRAIAERPGRIYEGKQQDFNLFNETKSALETLKDAQSDFSKKTVSDG